MILDLCPYWTNPTTGGGPERVYHLCQSISRISKVTEVSFRPTLTMIRSGLSPIRRNHVTVGAKYSEVQIPHLPSMASSMATAALGMPQDLFMSQSCSVMTPRAVVKMAANASVVQVEHPWLTEYANRLNTDRKPLVLSTHNCETALVAGPNDKNPRLENGRVIKRIARIESEALASADQVIAVSEQDVLCFEEYLGVAVSHKTTIAPNGVNCRLTTPATDSERMEAKKLLGVDSQIVAVFMGSRHTPNVAAVEKIMSEEKRLRTAGVKAFVVGSVGEKFKSTGSVTVTGHVPDFRLYLRAADVALNPLESGSGTSLKLLEYLAAGLPTVTTAVGARGIKVTNNRDAIVADDVEFMEQVMALSRDEEARMRLAVGARNLAEEYDWSRIESRVLDAYGNLDRI